MKRGVNRKAVALFALFAGALLFTAESAFAAAKIYKVRVKTADKKDAETDSKVEILLTGVNGGTSMQTNLDTKDKNDRKRGAIDEYSVQANDDIGPIKQITITRSGKSDGWLLDWVEVRYPWEGSPYPLYPVEGQYNLSKFTFNGSVPKDEPLVLQLDKDIKVGEITVEMRQDNAQQVLQANWARFLTNFTQESRVSKIEGTETIANSVKFSQKEGETKDFSFMAMVSGSAGFVSASVAFGVSVSKATETTKETQGTETQSVTINEEVHVPAGMITVADIQIWRIMQTGYVSYNDYATTKAHKYAFATPKWFDVIVQPVTFKIVEKKKESGKTITIVEPLDANAIVTKKMASCLKDNDCRLLNPGIVQGAPLQVGAMQKMDPKLKAKLTAGTMKFNPATLAPPKKKP